jgi:hypothetical protein
MAFVVGLPSDLNRSGNPFTENKKSRGNVFIKVRQSAAGRPLVVLLCAVVPTKTKVVGLGHGTVRQGREGGCWVPRCVSLLNRNRRLSSDVLADLSLSSVLNEGSDKRFCTSHTLLRVVSRTSGPSASETDRTTSCTHTRNLVTGTGQPSSAAAQARRPPATQRVTHVIRHLRLCHCLAKKTG